MVKLIFPLGLSFCLIFVFQNSSSIQLNTTEQVTQDTCIGKRINGLREGVWECYYDGKYHRFIYHLGKLEGITGTFYDKEKTKPYLIESYVNGQREGNSVSFFMNGLPHYITTFQKGRYTKTMEYDSTGNLLIEGKYILDSVETTITTFSPPHLDADNIENIKELQEVKHGTWLFYNNDGAINKEYYYDRGLLKDSLIMK